MVSILVMSKNLGWLVLFCLAFEKISIYVMQNMAFLEFNGTDEVARNVSTEKAIKRAKKSYSDISKSVRAPLFQNRSVTQPQTSPPQGNPWSIYLRRGRWYHFFWGLMGDQRHYWEGHGKHYLVYNVDLKPKIGRMAAVLCSFLLSIDHWLCPWCLFW